MTAINRTVDIVFRVSSTGGDSVEKILGGLSALSSASNKIVKSLTKITSALAKFSESAEKAAQPVSMMGGAMSALATVLGQTNSKLAYFELSIKDIKGAVAATSKEVNALQKNLTTLEKKGPKSLDRRSAGVDNFQTAMAAASVSAALLASIAFPVKAAGEFEEMMLRVLGASNANAVQFKELGKAAKAAAIEFGAMPKDVASGLLYVAKAGRTAAESIAALPDILRLAKAGELEVGEAAELANSILRQQGFGIDKLSQLNDYLVTAADLSITSVRNLATALSYVGPIAKVANNEFSDLIAALAMLSQGGIDSSRSGTALRGVMSALLEPTKQEADALRTVADRIGKTDIAIKNADGSFLGFLPIVKQFEDAGLDAGEALRIFGDRAGPGLAVLVTLGSKALAEFSAAIEAARGSTKRKVDLYNQGFLPTLRKTAAAVVVLAIAVGSTLIGPLNLMAQAATFLAAKITSFYEALGPVGAVVTTVGSVLIVLSAIVGTLAVAWLLSIQPILLFVGALFGAQTATLTFSGTILMMSNGLKTFALLLITVVVDALKIFMSTVTGADLTTLSFAGTLSLAGTALKTFATWLTTLVVEAIRAFILALTGADMALLSFTGALGFATSALKIMVTWITTIAIASIRALIFAFFGVDLATLAFAGSIGVVVQSLKTLVVWLTTSSAGIFLIAAGLAYWVAKVFFLKDRVGGLSEKIKENEKELEKQQQAIEKARLAMEGKLEAVEKLLKGEQASTAGLSESEKALRKLDDSYKRHVDVVNQVIDNELALVEVRKTQGKLSDDEAVETSIKLNLFKYAELLRQAQDYYSEVSKLKGIDLREQDAAAASVRKATNDLNRERIAGIQKLSAITKQQIDDSVKKEEAAAERIKRLKEDITQERINTNDKRFEIFLRQFDKLENKALAQQIKDQYALARAYQYFVIAKTKLQQGDEEAAIAAANRSKEYYDSLQNEKTAMQGVGAASGLIVKALSQQKKEQEEVLAKQKANTDLLRQSLDGVDGKVREITSSIAKLAEVKMTKEVFVVVKGLDQITALQVAFDKLKDMSFTITTNVTGAIKRAAGGIINGIGGAFFPGFGGGDRRMILGEDGEFMIRKEAVRNYGMDLFAAFNNLSMPRYASGGLVGATAGSSSTGKNLGSLTLNIGGESFGVLAEESVFERLATKLRRERLTRG